MRMKSMISGRGLQYNTSLVSEVSEDIMGMNTERILEERLDREE